MWEQKQIQLSWSSELSLLNSQMKIKIDKTINSCVHWFDEIEELNFSLLHIVYLSHHQVRYTIFFIINEFRFIIFTHIIQCHHARLGSFNNFQRLESIINWTWEDSNSRMMMWIMLSGVIMSFINFNPWFPINFSH